MQNSPVRRYTTSFAVWGSWAILLLVILQVGCGAMSQQIESTHPSTTVKEFMQQPRPGNGILGP